MTSIQRTLNRLRADGWLCGTVQVFLQKIKIYRDLFGLADIAAVKLGEPGTLYVQATMDTNFSRHVEAALAHKNLKIILSSNRFEIWSWGLHGPRGKRKLWRLKRSVFAIVGGLVECYELAVDEAAGKDRSVTLR